MKFNFEDYKKYCKKHNLSESNYTSLAMFKHKLQLDKELSLILRHVKKFEKLNNQNAIECLMGR